jgi:hypothetical protein
MNEFKRCIRVFSHSPFKVRLMLISMLCDMINSKPEKDKPSENNAASRYAASFSCRHPGTVVVFVSITLLCQFCHVPRKTISL